MEANLSERFAQSRGRPIRLGDLEVHMIYERRVGPGDSIRVRRAAAKPSPVQALRLKTEMGKLLVHGQALEDVVLWSDTAPNETILVAEVPKKGTTLKIWNAWRDSHGTMQAWIGDAGMLIQEERDRVRLRCSDGMGGVCFDDLVVEVEFGAR
jgi:hypothetical protein